MIADSSPTSQQYNILHKYWNVVKNYNGMWKNKECKISLFVALECRLPKTLAIILHFKIAKKFNTNKQWLGNNLFNKKAKTNEPLT